LIPLAHKYMTAHFSGIGTSMKSGGIQLIVWAQTSTLTEIMQSCKSFLHVPTTCYRERNNREHYI